MTLRDLVPSLAGKKVPVRYEYRPLNSFYRDVDRFFDDFFNDFGIEPFSTRAGTFSPSLELSESEKEITVSAELPGLDEKDLDVSLTHDSLTISGEKKNEHESREKGYHLKERTYGSFRRTIPITHEIDAGSVKATFQKGVLTVKLPKSRRDIERSKKIHVKVD